MAHSYVLYPILLRLIAGNDSLPRQQQWQPTVHILMAVRNAEKILAQKLDSIINSNYPKDRVVVWLGSDASTDNTDSIARQYASVYTNIHLVRFDSRSGKITIINSLYDLASKTPDFDKSIVVSTDVTAIFDTQCLASLVSTFATDEVGIVGANINKSATNTAGIAAQEKAYYARELQMKYQEGIIWGSCMGVFGACFAIRPAAFEHVPSHFLADDFFITQAAFKKGFKALLDKEALVYMNLPADPKVEYNRKVRISTGNFQNLFYFFSMLIGIRGRVVAYWSHKVIRWLGPFCILACLITSAMLMHINYVYKLAFGIQLIIITLIPVGVFAGKLGLNIKVLKFITHFYHMNLGVFMGMVNYIKGVKSSVWEPTQR